MKHVSNERGAVSALAIALALVVVAAVGFAVYNMSKARNNDVKSGNTPPSPVGSLISTASPAATPSNVFVVKEVGIQFTLNDDIKDLGYAVRTLGDGSTGADFSSASMVATGGKACAANAGAPLGTITLTSNANFPDGQKVKHLGGKYLYYIHAQAVCWPGTTADSLSEKQIAAFQNALKSAELSQ
jgi:hypothetical protein